MEQSIIDNQRDVPPNPFVTGLLDALRDKAAKALDDGLDRLAFDEQVIQQALEMVDETLASPESARIMEVIEGGGRMVLELGCNHDHVMEQIEQKMQGSAGHGHGVGASGDSGHSHAPVRRFGGGPKAKNRHGKKGTSPPPRMPSRFTKSLLPQGGRLFPLLLQK
jgi:hypothetical protein